MTTAGFEDGAMMDYLDRVGQVAADPPGAREAEVGDIDGAQVRWGTDRRSPIRLNGQTLPARVLVLDRAGTVSLVPPTHAMKRVRGQRVFYSPDEYKRMVNDGILQPPKRREYIAETCSICNERRFNEGNSEPRRFESLSQYRGHMQGFHEREWEDEQREEALSLQRQQMEMMRLSVEAATGRKFEASTEKMPQVYYCDEEGCSRFFDSAQAVKMHKTTGHKGQ